MKVVDLFWKFVFAFIVLFAGVGFLIATVIVNPTRERFVGVLNDICYEDDDGEEL